LSPLLSLFPPPLFALPLSPSPFLPSFSFFPNLGLYTKSNDCASEHAFEIVGTDASNNNASSGFAFVCSAAYFGTASTLTTRADGDGLFSQSDYLGGYCSDVVHRVGDEATGPVRSTATQITTAWFESFQDYLALELGSFVENKNEAAGNFAHFSLKLKGNIRTDFCAASAGNTADETTFSFSDCPHCNHPQYSYWNLAEHVAPSDALSKEDPSSFVSQSVSDNLSSAVDVVLSVSPVYQFWCTMLFVPILPVIKSANIRRIVLLLLAIALSSTTHDAFLDPDVDTLSSFVLFYANFFFSPVALTVVMVASKKIAPAFSTILPSAALVSSKSNKGGKRYAGGAWSRHAAVGMALCLVSVAKGAANNGKIRLVTELPALEGGLQEAQRMSGHSLDMSNKELGVANGEYAYDAPIIARRLSDVCYTANPFDNFGNGNKLTITSQASEATAHELSQSGSVAKDTAESIEVCFGGGCRECLDGQVGGVTLEAETSRKIKDGTGTTVAEASNTASASFCLPACISSVCESAFDCASLHRAECGTGATGSTCGICMDKCLSKVEGDGNDRCVFNFGAADNVFSSISHSMETIPGLSSGSWNHALTFSRSFASTYFVFSPSHSAFSCFFTICLVLSPSSLFFCSPPPISLYISRRRLHHLFSHF